MTYYLITYFNQSSRSHELRMYGYQIVTDPVAWARETVDNAVFTVNVLPLTEDEAKTHWQRFNQEEFPHG